MKTSVLALSLLLLPSVASADEGPDNMLTLGLGFLVPYAPGDLSGFGVGGAVELKYNFSEHFSAGIRGEGNAIILSDFDVPSVTNATSLSLGTRAVTAYTVKGEARLGGDTSPFVGLGIGLYSLGEVTTGISLGARAGDQLGIAPQIGVDFGGMRLAATYHLVLGDAEVVVSTAEVQETSQNFFGIELGAQLGIL